MNIVADAGPICCRVVIPINRQSLPFAQGHFQGQGNQVGFRPVVFTDQAVRVGTRRVEVSQAHRLYPVPRPEVIEDLLNHEFTAPIRINGYDGVGFIHGYRGGFTIDRAGRGKNEPVKAVVCHLLQQYDGGGHIVAVVPTGILHRLAHVGKGREMHDGSNGISGKHVM